jgi:hypothetical protein
MPAMPVSAIGNSDDRVDLVANGWLDDDHALAKDGDIFLDVVDIVFNQVEQSFDMSRIAMHVTRSIGCIVFDAVKNCFQMMEGLVQLVQVNQQVV